MGNPILQKLLRDNAKALFFIERPCISLRLQIDGLRLKAFLRDANTRLQYPCPQAGATFYGYHAADRDPFAFYIPVKDTQTGFDPVFILQPYMYCFLITIIQLWIWAALLNNKYIHTQFEDLIQLIGCQFIKFLYTKPHLFFCLSAVRCLLFRVFVL